MPQPMPYTGDPYLDELMAVYENWDPSQPYSYYNDIPPQMYEMIYESRKPTSDSQASSRANRMAGLGEDWMDFSKDAVYQSDPQIQPWLIEALSGDRKQDPIEALAYLQREDTIARMLDEIGRTEWDEAARRNPGIFQHAKSGEEKDKAVLSYYQQMLEDVIRTGGASMSRNVGTMNTLLEAAGGRPQPGVDVPVYQGSGFVGDQSDPASSWVEALGGRMQHVDTGINVDRATLAQDPALVAQPRNAYWVELQKQIARDMSRGKTTRKPTTPPKTNYKNPLDATPPRLPTEMPRQNVPSSSGPRRLPRASSRRAASRR